MVTVTVVWFLLLEMCKTHKKIKLKSYDWYRRAY